jgi:hypothetical protein
MLSASGMLTNWLTETYPDAVHQFFARTRIHWPILRAFLSSLSEGSGVLTINFKLRQGVPIVSVQAVIFRQSG